MFDLSKFNDAIHRFQSTLKERQDAEGLIREGLRVVLEPFERTSPDQLKGGIEGILDRGVRLEPMFPGADELPPGLFFDPGRFLLLTVPEMAYEAVGSQAYDLAYHLRDKLNLRSAEPDVPYLRYAPPTVQQASGCWEPEGGEPSDYAWSLRNMHVPAAWALAPPGGGEAKGGGIRIGHPDTGYSDHIDLDRRRLDLASGYDFVDGKPDPQDPLDYSGGMLSPGHGTATGSVIVSEGGVTTPPAGGAFGGTTPPGRVTGVAPAATLVPLRAIRSVIRILSGNVARAIYRAVQQDCHVISMSLGGVPSRALHAAIEHAVNRNLIVLAAAGNCVKTVVWPARYKNCIALAASNIDDRPWKGSSRGGSVAVSAPGEYVWCARRKAASDPAHDVIDGGQGTSYATANAAGVAALWLAFHNRNALIDACARKGATLQDTFRSLLRQTARIPQPGWDTARYGAGIVDAERLLGEQVVPQWSSLAYEDYAYIGHVGSALEVPVSGGYLQILRALFPSADPSIGRLWGEMEGWGHELANLLINDDALREDMQALLQDGSDLRRPDAPIWADIVERLRAQASATLAGILGRH